MGRWIGQWLDPQHSVHPDDLDLLLLTATTVAGCSATASGSPATRYVSPVLAAYVGETVTVQT